MWLGLCISNIQRKSSSFALIKVVKRNLLNNKKIKYIQWLVVVFIGNSNLKKVLLSMITGFFYQRSIVSSFWGYMNGTV